jgi:hypothetical protein
MHGDFALRNSGYTLRNADATVAKAARDRDFFRLTVAGDDPATDRRKQMKVVWALLVALFAPGSALTRWDKVVARSGVSVD